MKKKLIIGGIVLLILLMAGGFGVWKIVSTAGKAPAVTMPIVKVERGDVEKTVFAKGIITQVQKQEVTPEAKANVTRVAVKAGDRVKAGDLLFAMDEGDASLAARQEEITYQSKADDLARAQAAVNTDIIRTPVTGKVVKVFVKDGDKIDQDSLVAEIADPSTLDVIGAFAPIGIEKVTVGQKVKVFLDNWTNFYGTVTKVD